MENVFLTGSWNKLIMANYAVDPSLLQPYLPAGTELNFYHNTCLISLVGFQFNQVKIKGISIPFHKNFPEVNLRFYVKRKEANTWKPGVVFISEYVPKPAIALVAKTLFGEKYKALPMKQAFQAGGEFISVEYNWKTSKEWNALSAKALATPVPMQPDSEAAFIFEHYYGYSKQRNQSTVEYQVDHPTWQLHPIMRYGIFCNFENSYGPAFSILNQQAPQSVFMAEGSAVSVGNRKKL